MKPPSPTQRVPVPLRRRFQWLVMAGGPPFMWVAALVACLYLYRSDARSYTAKGYFHPRETIVVPLVGGRLMEVPVEPFKPLNAGAVVAVFDDSELQAEVAALQAQLGVAQAEVQARRTELSREQLLLMSGAQIDRRRLEVDVSNSQLTALDRRIDIEVGRIDITRLRLEEDRLARLVNEGIRSAAELDELRLTREAMEKNLEQNERFVEEVQVQLAEARTRLTELSAILPAEDPLGNDQIVAPLERQVDVLTAEIELVRARLRNMVLRSPIDGVVAEAFARAGEVVGAGSPLVRIAAPEPEQLLAYLPPEAPMRPTVGDVVRVRRSATSGAVEARGTVSAVGVGFTMLPSRLFRNQAVPEFGQPIQITLEEGRFLPGEVVHIVFAR